MTVSCSHEHAAWPGTVSISAATLHPSCATSPNRCAAPVSATLILVNGHGGNYVLRNVVQESAGTGTRMALFPGLGRLGRGPHRAGVQTPSHSDMHAGEVETSILLHAHPELVRPGYETSDCLADDRKHLLTLGMRAYTESGVIGRPSLASAAKGKELLAGLADSFAEYLSLVAPAEARRRGPATPRSPSGRRRSRDDDAGHGTGLGATAARHTDRGARPEAAGLVRGADGAVRWRRDATPEADDLADRYLPLCLAGPRLTFAQLGQSLDGFIATRTGDADYVTGEEDRGHLHRLRALADAVVVGAGTAVADDPQLTVRACAGPHPVRVVLDPHGRVPLQRRVFTDGAAPTLWVVGADSDARAAGAADATGRRTDPAGPCRVRPAAPGGGARAARPRPGAGRGRRRHRVALPP